MLELNTLESLYDHIESSSLTEFNKLNITDTIRKFRDAKLEANDTEAAEKAQWEIHFLSFYFTDGEIRPNVERVYENGKVSIYPSLDLFDEKVYECLRKRLKETKHPKLKAHYAQILWNSPKTKHNDFAKTAIDCYLEYLADYEQSGSEDDYYVHEICEVMKNTYSIGLHSKYKIDQLKSRLLHFIHKFSLNDPFFVRNFISYMLEKRKGFKKEDFEGLENICWQIAESFSNDADIAISYLRLGEKIDQKLQNQSHEWIRRIAEHNEGQMKLFEKAPEVALVFCMKAIHNYKQVGDSVKQKELENRYSELKKSTKYHTIKTEFDIKDFLIATQDYVREFVKKATSEDIIRVLISDKILLSTKSEIESSVRESMRMSPTVHLLPKVITDRNSNVVQHFDTPDELKYHSLLESYKLQLETSKIHFIRAILIEAISEKKLTIRNLLQGLNKFCWYGKIPNWVELIAPALNEYFEQVMFYLDYPERNKPNFVLCLDSLTLKIEGLFRELCRISGVQTTYHKQDHANRQIAFEKDIEMLLREKAIEQLFDEDDILFFKFLLVEKCGYNLRHKIAHALLPFDQYHFDLMNLMILALFRLGKYDFAQQSEVENENGNNVDNENTDTR
ncbi:DUF4209 domain-containing protein [Candidatus Poribacteria bacterium]|nr:DUF4209 domain-containing protein [Candidatus Poribacteria bacterium]